jgi:VIT1/CCC1 family predicted Fe2+/Mn2+ transporter
MSKLYQRISKLKLSTLIISVLVMGFTVFLLGGGLYDVIQAPLPAATYQGRILIVYPGLSEQFLGDSAVAMMIYSVGIAGILLMYQSTRYAFKPRQAYLMLMIGLVFLFVAYVFLEATIAYKIAGKP